MDWTRRLLFCHRLAETEDYIHNALKENGMVQFVLTACYEVPMHMDKVGAVDKRAFPIDALKLA